MQKIFIAADHAGFDLKAQLIAALPDYQWQDLGPAAGQKVDYPDYAAKCCELVLKTPDSLGVLICGSGIGMSIAANKFRGIRAALVSEIEVAKLAKEHNNANVLCLGARFLESSVATEITRSFIETTFSNDERHENRIKKLEKLT